MRTTLNLDDQLLIQARRLAEDQATTLTALIEAALRSEIQLRSQQRTAPYRWEPITVAGTAPLPVDVADRDALEAFLEAEP